MKVEQKNIYRCSYCNHLFEDAAECENHEKLCGEHIEVKTIWMHTDLVTGDPYFSVTTNKWSMATEIGQYARQRLNMVLPSLAGSSSYYVYTADLSQETESKFKLELLNYRRKVFEERVKEISEKIARIDKEIRKITSKMNNNRKGGGK